MNNINLEEFKKDYYNSMPYEDLLLKYNIKDFYYRAIRKRLGLSRPKIKRMDYIFNINNLSNETDNLPVNKPINLPVNKPVNKPVDKPVNLPVDKPDILPVNLPAKKKKPSKSNINIKTIETDNGVPEYEIKKCDTTYNADKSKLLDALKLSTETLNKINSKKK
jgi:hypothetical protein